MGWEPELPAGMNWSWWEEEEKSGCQQTNEEDWELRCAHGCTWDVISVSL